MKHLTKYLLIFWISLISLFMIMWATREVVLETGVITGFPHRVIWFSSNFISNLNTYLFTEEVKKPIVIKSTLKLKNGFNYTKDYKKSDDYLLISVWDDTIGQSIIKLLRINDGKLIYKWKPDIIHLNKLFNVNKTYGKNEITAPTTRLMHPVLLSDGSIIVNAGGVYKIDKDARLIWANTTDSHHSLEADADGDFWICSYSSNITNAKKYEMKDDAIKKISGINGKTLFEKSVFDILMENGYERGRFFISPSNHVFTNKMDYVHLNDVQPVLRDSKYWKKGDVFLSINRQNLILLYRPSTNKIIWSQNGPWLKQHNVDIIDSSHISIFGNNVIDDKFKNKNDRFIDGHNREYLVDFSTNKITTPFDPFFKTANIRSTEEGFSRVLNDNTIFVDETTNGRLLCGTNKKELWTYIERINESGISMFSWSRYITEEEFKNLTFIHKR